MLPEVLGRVVCYLPSFLLSVLMDLLMELGRTNSGLRIGQLLINNLACADDLNLLAASVMIILKSKRWRFVFGFAKTKCTTFGKVNFPSPPIWTLIDKVVQNRNYIENLGVNFRADLKSSMHVDKRLSAARRKAYSLLNEGLSYPGLATEVKVHLWKTSVSPLLCYGAHCLSIKARYIAFMESFQKTNIKRIFGFPKCFHHTKLLLALDIKGIGALIHSFQLSLYNRMFKVDSIARDF
jgi:hypothetical protein